MTRREVWARRVAEWRASGKTSAAFAAGQPFTGSGLRHWAHRLSKEPRPPRRLRVVRVERRPRAAERAAPSADASLVVELGPARVVVRPGFDRTLLAAVLEVALAAAGGREA